MSDGSSKLVNQALGYMNTLISFSIVFGPTMSGYLFQIQNNYIMAYNISIATLLAAAIIISFYPDTIICKLINFVKWKYYRQKRPERIILYRF